MGRGLRQDLYLQVDGNIVGLRQAMMAGKTVVNEFGGAAINVIEEVEKEFAKLGTSGLPNLKQVESSYTASFKRIGDQARAVLNAPTPQAAVQIIDAGAARQAAENATAQAAGLRLVAEAASRADLATGGADKATRAYAVAAATAALGAEDEARALREQAVVLANVEQQLGLTGAAQRRVVAVNGAARAGAIQLSQNLGDVAVQYNAGTAASIIFANQSGQIVQAIGLINGEAKGLIGFLSGPYGIAISAAAIALTPFVSKLLEGDDALGKETQSLQDNAEKTVISEQAKKAFARTEAGLVDDVRALTDEIKKQNDALLTNAERLNIRAKQDIEKGEKLRPAAVKRVENARLDVEAARISEQAGATGALARAQAALAVEEANLLALDKSIASANAARLATQRDLAAEAAKRANDPVAAITYKYEGDGGLIEQKKKQATAEEVINGTLTRRLKLLGEQQKLEIENAQKRIAAAKSSGTGNQQFGREIDVAQAKAIAESIGGRVTSGKRSTERQAQLYADKLAGRHDGPVAAPGTSAHETGNAIDIAYGAGISVKSIREAFAKEGVKLRKILNEPGQKVFHVEFGKVGPSADTTARKAEVEANQNTLNADEYAFLLSRAKQEQLTLERSRVTSISAAADLDVKAVEAAQADLDRAAQKGVELDKWTQAEADAVKAVNASNAEIQKHTIREREKLALGNRQFELEQMAVDDKVALLQLEGDLADTAEERRKIARKLLQIEQDQVEEALRNQIANEKDEERRAALQKRLDGLPAVYAAKGEQQDRQNADPVQRYKGELQKSAGDINEAFKQVEADGLKSLEDGLVGIISGTESVGDAFKRMADQIIADLIRIAIQKLILSALGGGEGGSGFLGLFADGGVVGGGGGGSSGFYDPGDSDRTLEDAIALIYGKKGGLFGFASGGKIRGPGTGRSDSILAMVNGGGHIRVSNGEAIVNARGVRNHWPLIDAINNDRLPKFADGGLVAPASFVPRLPSISRAQQALRPTGGFNMPFTLTIHAPGADAAALARVEQSVRQLRAELPGQIISTVSDAQARGFMN